MAQKIIYLNQTLLNHPEIQKILRDYDHDWDCLQMHRRFDPGTQSLYPRVGINNMPFRNDIVDIAGWGVPKFDEKFDGTFETVTDARCQELYQTKFDKPWTIYWSGGIDSTVIMVSVLKNITPADRKNIRVACNRGSIVEYPWFYFNYIKPNFRVIDSSLSVDSMDTSCYSINGEPADQLFAGSISQNMLLSDNQSMTRSIADEPDPLISYISKVTDSKFAHWYYDHVLENIKSVSIPIHTYHDFFWWTFFNHSWVATKMRVLKLSAWGKLPSAQPCLESFINWFDTEQYQSWSMVSNTRDQKYGHHVGAYKQSAKDYIFSFNKDAYYHRFKTKTSSGSHYTDYQTWFCMLDDFRLLSLDKNLPEILDLLPAHINHNS